MQFTLQRPKHFIPAIGKLGRMFILRWRAWRLNRKRIQDQIDRVDDRFFVGGFYVGRLPDGRYIDGGGYEAYKRERKRAKHLKFPF